MRDGLRTGDTYAEDRARVKALADGAPAAAGMPLVVQDRLALTHVLDLLEIAENACTSCECRPASLCIECVRDDRALLVADDGTTTCPHCAGIVVGGVRPSDPQPAPVARERSVVQLADDIITALDTHDTHRLRHIRQAAERIKKLAAGGGSST